MPQPTVNALIVNAAGQPTVNALIVDQQGNAVMGAANSGTPSDIMLTAPYWLFSTGSAIGGANRSVGARVVAPRTGFLRDMTTTFAVQSGNIDIGVYDTGQAAAAVRTKLGSSGSIACPAAIGGNQGVVTWDPGPGVIPIVAGQQYEFHVAIDNVTATIYRYISAMPPWLPPSYTQTTSGAASAQPKMALTVLNNFPLANVPEANVFHVQFLPFIMARVSAT